METNSRGQEIGMLLKKLVSENNPQAVAELIHAQLKIGQLTCGELNTQVFSQHWRDESLHEVLKEIAAKLDKARASEIIEYLTDQNGQEKKFINLFLAAQCLLKVKKGVKKTTEKKLLKALKKLSQYGTGFLILYQSAQELQETYQIRHRSIAAIAQTWKNDPQTLPWLLQLAHTREWGEVRATAIEAIARGWPDEPEIYLMLKNLALGDPSWAVRSTCVREIASGWPDTKDTLPLLRALAKSDRSPGVRTCALEQLASNWPDRADTLRLLRTAAESDENLGVRVCAWQEIARRWHSVSGTASLLKNLAQTGSSILRTVAVRELAAGWSSVAEVCLLLARLGASDRSRGER